MASRRLRAPAQDGGILAAPPLADAANLLLANRERLASWDHDFQGRSSHRLRRMVRGQVLAEARAFAVRLELDAPEPADPAAPLVVTGHQPELFHPGVWIKNFALQAIAREVGGSSLNLIVDNDTPKSASIRVPTVTGGRLRSIPVEFDDWAGEAPYEDLAVRDEERFASFPDRVAEVLGDQVADPLIQDFWPRALASSRRTDRIGYRFAAARHGVEASWGIRNAEVPLGLACETEGFLWFACHLLAHLPRFQQVHNEALDRHRRAHGIRSRHHPVPALSQEGDWREAPFWAWRASNPRRRPLFARQLDRSMQLRIGGETEVLAEIPLSPDRDACCAVEELQRLPSLGVRLRTRALTTTMFARFLLADLFVHGIGGAKYDELGDAVALGFFGVEPPPFLTLSMTLRLGLGVTEATEDRRREVVREIRDLAFNPDRHLAGPLDEATREWVETKLQAIAAPQTTRARRLDRLRTIRECNAALQPLTSAALEARQAERMRLDAGLLHNTLARGREFAAPLHSRERFRGAVADALPTAFS